MFAIVEWSGGWSCPTKVVKQVKQGRMYQTPKYNGTATLGKYDLALSLLSKKYVYTAQLCFFQYIFSVELESCVSLHYSWESSMKELIWRGRMSQIPLLLTHPLYMAYLYQHRNDTF